jgi:hypothetical protein
MSHRPLRCHTFDIEVNETNFTSSEHIIERSDVEIVLLHVLSISSIFHCGWCLNFPCPSMVASTCIECSCAF